MSSNKSSIISQQNLTEDKSYVNETYEFEDFRLDAAHLMLYRDDKTIPLKPKVIETLVALVERRGEVVGKDELMDRLWADSFVEESNLTQNIYLLRKTLGKCRDGRPFIETFSRRGYRFNGEVRPLNGSELLIATRTRTQTVIEEETIERSADRTRNRLMIGAVVICGLLLLSGFAFLKFKNKDARAAAPFDDFKFKRHSDKGDVTSAAISRDGKFIAYSDQKKALWLKNTATESVVKTMPESEADSHVGAISPDNNNMYITRSAKDKKSEVIKVSLFGGAAQQKVAEDTWSGFDLSPDGREIAFIRGSDTGEIALMIAQTDGSGERKVAVTSGAAWFGLWGQTIAWSPDGERIACTGGISSEGKESWNIKILRASDGAELSLIPPAPNSPWISDIAWMPDGDNLLTINGEQSSLGQIYRYTISTGEWHRVTNDLSNYMNLSITADGKTIVTRQDDNPGNLWLLPADGNTGEARQITFGRNLFTDMTGLSWTPDGKIVYATNASGRWEIWIVDATGGNEKQLTQNCFENDSCSQPVVSPDGRYIVFQASRNGVRSIWRMDVDGSNPKQLTEGGTYPSFTPDGRFVVYSRQVDNPALLRVSIEGGEPEEFNKISTALAASVSPDGKVFAFNYYDKTAKQPFLTCVAPVEADRPERCYDNSRSFPRWMADSTGYYYLDHGYAGIWKQPLNGKRGLFLEFPGERTDNFAFSPDGKQLVVARSKPTLDMVALISEK
jgi:Tol biopolymer transport system component/DNA-binding winged helix-turn-helix (wHTH) protein